MGGAAEAVSKLVRRSILLPLLREVEERAGERRGVFIGNSPLLNPHPARSSRGEEEAKSSFETVSAAPPYRHGGNKNQFICGGGSTRAKVRPDPPVPACPAQE
jgi:hypothetical protein